MPQHVTVEGASGEYVVIVYDDEWREVFRDDGYFRADQARKAARKLREAADEPE